jgi:hypothetical protein
VQIPVELKIVPCFSVGEPHENPATVAGVNSLERLTSIILTGAVEQFSSGLR